LRKTTFSGPVSRRGSRFQQRRLYVGSPSSSSNVKNARIEE
jgi:hypothetical protein